MFFGEYDLKKQAAADFTPKNSFLDLEETSIDPDFNYATVKCYRKVDALRSTSQTFDKASVLQRLSYVFISRNRRFSSETERMLLHRLFLINADLEAEKRYVSG